MSYATFYEFNLNVGTSFVVVVVADVYFLFLCFYRKHLLLVLHSTLQNMLCTERYRPLMLHDCIMFPLKSILILKIHLTLNSK